MKCPKCNADRKPEDVECPHCGVDYAYVEQKLKKRTDASFYENQAPDLVRIACPHCGQRYRVAPKKIGVFSRCKKCDEVFETKPLVVLKKR